MSMSHPPGGEFLDFYYGRGSVEEQQNECAEVTVFLMILISIAVGSNLNGPVAICSFSSPDPPF